MTKFHRLYEAAFLKTLGATRRLIILITLIEYGALGLLAGAIGSAAAIAMTWAISKYGLDLIWQPEPSVNFIGVVATLALFIGLVWRSFWIAQLASRAGLKFQSYLALGFGLWLGAQALINIGVNMGVLPTKGLTLPLMSYGRSSMIVTLAWVGLLLRVYHEAMQSGRGMATSRRSDEDSAPRGSRAAGALT